MNRIDKEGLKEKERVIQTTGWCASYSTRLANCMDVGRMLCHRYGNLQLLGKLENGKRGCEEPLLRDKVEKQNKRLLSLSYPVKGNAIQHRPYMILGPK